MAMACSEKLPITIANSAVTLIHNGSGMARRPLPHVHIVCARTRWQKALVYFYIGMRNLLPTR